MWLSPRFNASTTGLDDVDEEDPLSGLGERLREREADVASTDNSDVPAHAREGYRAAAMCTAARPSP